MAKRARRARSKDDNKCMDQHSSIDLISMLPDELLVVILSFLPLKDAIATSILSSRWRYLWTFIPALVFDGRKWFFKKMSKSTRNHALLDAKMRKYVTLVDHVLALHKNSTLEELRVLSYLTKTYKTSIDEWLRYALAGKVQRLELNLETVGSNYDNCYTFPYELLCTVDFKYLKTISMNYVNVNSEAVEFLCNCPLLEHLSVSQSGELSTLKISGPFRSLKSLEISFCHNLKSVEICDTNLVYLKYQGSMIDFLLENVLLLVEVFLGGMVTEHMKSVLLMLSSYLPQLEIFTIVKKSCFSWKETHMFFSTVKMSNLKQLVIRGEIEEDCSLLPITNLIRASPCLQRFVFEASWLEPVVVKRKLKKVARGSYIHLREVQFVGYYGRTSDLEFIMHFLENSAALEKIVVDPCEPYLRMKDISEINADKAARNCAVQQLKGKVAPGINLNILY